MWHGIIVDSWRDIVKARKKASGLSNIEIGERAHLTESVVQRALAEGSDPPLSHITAIANALEMQIEDLFMPSLPNGMKIKSLIEEYTRLKTDYEAMTEKLLRLEQTVKELEQANSRLKDDLIDAYKSFRK
jgi:transcriptional regulator with XRE-family HTH domain